MRKHRAILPLALITGGVLGLVLAASWAADRLPQFQFLQRLEWMSYDWRVRRAPADSAPLPARFGFVYIDDDSVRALGERRLLGEAYGLFWPRHIYGRLVRELGTQGARFVGMDVIFAETSPGSSRGRPAGRQARGLGRILRRGTAQSRQRRAGHRGIGRARSALPRGRRRLGRCRQSIRCRRRPAPCARDQRHGGVESDLPKRQGWPLQVHLGRKNAFQTRRANQRRAIPRS
jgi:hypothetical protein